MLFGDLCRGLNGCIPTVAPVDLWEAGGMQTAVRCRLRAKVCMAAPHPNSHADALQARDFLIFL